MNRRLLDPFQAAELPEVIEEYLEHGVAKCAAFNRRGTLLAAGTVEGWVVIWDFDTRGVAKVLRHGRSQPATGSPQLQTVTSLCWSRDGRCLVSGSVDQRVVLWDVELGSKMYEYQLESAVSHVSLSPGKPYRILATLATAAPMLFDVEANTATPVPSVILGADRSASTSLAPATAIFSKDGSTILLGQTKGLLTLFDTETQRVLDVIKIPGAPKVLGMVLNRQGSLLLLNCHDRMVRMFELARRGKDLAGVELSQLSDALGTQQVGQSGSLLLGAHSLVTPSHQFQNAVERTQWQGVAFSADCEHVAGAAVAKQDHNIYVWGRHSPRLEKILEGPRNETILDLVWHPCRSMVVSISSTGRMYIWAKIFDEVWSAFAPDFQELDENVEYVEREDEFDENPREDAALTDVTGDAEEEEVDVLTKEEIAVFSSDDDEDSQALHYLRAVVQLDGPELADPDGEAAAQQHPASNGDATTQNGNEQQAGAMDGSNTGSGQEDAAASSLKRKGPWEDEDAGGHAKRSRPSEAGSSSSGASGSAGNGSMRASALVAAGQTGLADTIQMPAAGGQQAPAAAPVGQPVPQLSSYTSSYSHGGQHGHS